MDIERVRYSLIKYLRIRILKIEKTFLSILGSLEMMERLSKEEKVFLTRLSNLQNTFYEETLYNRLSENIKESVEKSDDCQKNSHVSLSVSILPLILDPSSLSSLSLGFTLPFLQNYVFCRVLKDLSHVDTGDGNVQNFLRGEMFIAKYFIIREYLLNNQLELL